MTKEREALKLALEALEEVVKWYQVRDKNDEPLPVHNQNPEIKASIEAISAIKEALAQPEYRAVKTYHEGKPVYVAQQEQKYRRGDRLICLETEEYCVIHISGTDRQWIKFPDSHIGVYTNEQVAELFELLPKEQPQPEQNLNCKSVQARLATAWGYVKAQPQQETKEYVAGFNDGLVGASELRTLGEKIAQQEPIAWMYPDDLKRFETSEAYAEAYSIEMVSPIQGETVPLYISPPQRKPLTDEEMFKIWLTVPAETEDRFAFARAIEAAHGIGDNT